MSKANKNFQRLKQQVHIWKGKDTLKNRGKEMPKYLDCIGTFDSCPSEEEFGVADKDPKNPPEPCWKCSVFTESKYYIPKIYPSRLELWKKMMGV